MRLDLGRDAVLEFVDDWGLLDDTAGRRFDEISARRRGLATAFWLLDHKAGGAAAADGRGSPLRRNRYGARCWFRPRPRSAGC